MYWTVHLIVGSGFSWATSCCLRAYSFVDAFLIWISLSHWILWIWWTYCTVCPHRARVYGHGYLDTEKLRCELGRSWFAISCLRPSLSQWNCPTMRTGCNHVVTWLGEFNISNGHGWCIVLHLSSNYVWSLVQRLLSWILGHPYLTTNCYLWQTRMVLHDDKLGVGNLDLITLT